MTTNVLDLDRRRGSRAGDRVFGLLTGASGIGIVALVVVTGIFLLWFAIPALRVDQANFLLAREWVPRDTPPRFGIADLAWTTVLSSALALALAAPVATGVALFLTQYAPRRIARPIGSVVDLLAAVPSIVFGLWGIKELAPHLAGVSTFLTTYFGWIPLFHKGIADSGTVFVAGVVLAIMILPIVTALAREAFARTPTTHQEAALALGATKWETIRMTVLPYGRSGLVSAMLLGLGRALGETVAVMVILSAPSPGSPFDPSLFAGGETFASKIASGAGEFDTPTNTGAYIAAGLVLFVLTFVVNAIARIFLARKARREARS